MNPLFSLFCLSLLEEGVSPNRVSGQSIGPGGVITGTSEPYLPNQNTYSGMSMQPEEEEPEVIKLATLNSCGFILRTFQLT